MDDSDKQAVHDAIGKWVAEEGEVLTRWCLVAELVDGSGRIINCHRAGTAGGDNPAATEAIGLLIGSLATAIAQVVRDTRDMED